AYGVDRAVATGDRAERRLALAQPHLVAPVDAFLVRSVLALEADLAADVGHVRVGEVAHEPTQRVRRPGRVRVAEREDLALGLADGAVHRRQLSGSRALEQADAVVAANDLVRAVGRGVGGDHELELVSRVVELEQVLDALLDHVFLVVRRHDHRHRRLDLGLVHRPGAHAPQRRRGHRVADVRPREAAEARPEDRLQDHRRATLAARYAGKKPSYEASPPLRRRYASSSWIALPTAAGTRPSGSKRALKWCSES